MRPWFTLPVPTLADADLAVIALAVIEQREDES